MPATTFKYEDLAQKLLRQIAVSRLQPGDRLPTEDELVQEHSLSRITVRRALLILEEGGFVSRRRKLGTVVVRSIQAPSEMHLVRRTVVVVLPNRTQSTGEDHALASLLRGMESTFADQGFGVQILGLGKDPVQDRARLSRLLERGGLDGLCTVGSCVEPYLDLLQSVPVVYSCTFAPTGSPWVGGNNHEATRICIEYLLERGHVDIAMLCTAAVDNKSFAPLVTGYREAFDNRKIQFNRTLLHCAYAGESLTDLAEQVLLSTPAPTAVFAQDWQITRAVIQAAQKLGKQIPADLSLLSIGQNNLFVPSPVAITAYVPNNEGVGREAAKALIRLVDTKNSQVDPIFVPGKFLERDSVAVRKV